MIAAAKIIPLSGKLGAKVGAREDKLSKAVATGIESTVTKERGEHGEEATAANATTEVTVKEAKRGLSKARDEGGGGQLTAGAETHTMKTSREVKAGTDNAMVKSIRIEMALNMGSEGAVNDPSGVSGDGRRKMAKPVVKIGSDAVIGGGPRVMAMRMEQSLGSR